MKIKHVFKYKSYLMLQENIQMFKYKIRRIKTLQTNVKVTYLTWNISKLKSKVMYVCEIQTSI